MAVFYLGAPVLAVSNLATAVLIVSYLATVVIAVPNPFSAIVQYSCS